MKKKVVVRNRKLLRERLVEIESREMTSLILLLLLPVYWSNPCRKSVHTAYNDVSALLDQTFHCNLHTVKPPHHSPTSYQKIAQVQPKAIYIFPHYQDSI